MNHLSDKAIVPLAPIQTSGYPKTVIPKDTHMENAEETTTEPIVEGTDVAAEVPAEVVA